MENQITIREATTETDAALFWEQLHIYHQRDIFPHPSTEDRDYFFGDEYRPRYRNSTTDLRIGAAICSFSGTGRTSALPCR